jgi:zinc transport system substrate-binding protein
MSAIGMRIARNSPTSVTRDGPTCAESTATIRMRTVLDRLLRVPVIKEAEMTGSSTGWCKAVVGVSVSAVLLAGCGDDDSSGAPSSASALNESSVDVVASFYPLQFVAERVGGGLIGVENLTPAGVEPHDLELTPQDVASLEDSDLVVYLSGFSPALDDAVDGLSAAFDVAPAARLDIEGPEDEHHEDEHDEDDHDEDAHDDEDGTHDEGDAEHEASGGDADDEASHGTTADHDDESGADDEHDHGGVDPHFWLDPTRLADVADAVAARLAELDADHGSEYTANAAALRAELMTLDAEFEDGLAECASTDLVTSHTAFAYLAQRYGLTQMGISGLSPEEEPTPASLAEVTAFVRDHGVSTIYYETLVDPAIADTVAAETGASTAVLDPLEGLTEASAGSDYLEVMRSNLNSLRAGQGCK